jgi:hypothetical protein
LRQNHFLTKVVGNLKANYSIGIKTDAILVKSSTVLLEKYFHFDATKIGSIKFESGKTLRNKKIIQEKNKKFELQDTYLNNIQLKDEYDTKEINICNWEVILPHQHQSQH